MKIKYRQGIINHQQSPFFLDLTGNDVFIRANDEDTIIAFAFGDADFIYAETDDILAWSGPFSATVDYWLYWDIDLTTGIRTFGKTTVQPTVSHTLPSNPLLDQHVFLRSSNVMKVWNGNYWESVARVFAGVVDAGSVSAFNITSSQGGLNYPSRAGFLLFDDEGKLLVDSSGIPLNTESSLLTQSSIFNDTKLGADIETGRSEYTTIPKYRCVSWISFGNKITVTDPRDGRRCNAITLETGQRSENTRILTQGYVTDLVDFGWSEPPNTPLFVGHGGEITTVPPKTDSIQKIGYIVDERTIYIKPEPLILIDPPNLISVTPTPTPSVSAVSLMDRLVRPTPTPTRSLTPTPSVTASVTPTPSVTASVTPTPTPTASTTPTLTATPTPTPTPSQTPSSSVTPTPTPSNSASMTPTPSQTSSVTPTPTPTPSPTPTGTSTPTPTPTPTPSSMPLEILEFPLIQDTREVKDR